MAERWGLGVKICKWDGCDRALVAQGYCSMHYQRLKLRGQITRLQRGVNEPIDSITARFWSRARIAGPDECWEWTGPRDQKGRGHFNAFGLSSTAPRVAYCLTHGHFPNNYACHTCDNPGCVNPAHIYDGTQLQNLADAVRRGRLKNRKTHRGEECHGHKLTEVQVFEIRRMLDGGATKRGLAQEFGVRPQTINSIAQGKSWAHLLEQGVSE